jgi:hypothetical protein
VPSAQAVEGRKWIVEDLDFFSSLRMLANRSLSIGEWLRSFRGIQETACFASDDPLPFLLMAATDCCEIAQWLRGRLRTRKTTRGPQPSVSSTSAS